MADTTLRMILLGEDRSASKALKGVGDEAEKVGTKTKTAGSVMKGALGAAVFAGAASAVVDFGKDSVTAFRDADASQRKLEDAYSRFPALADVSIGRQRELNQAIQDKTGADADDIAAAQAKLAAYKLSGSQISQLTPLMVDYARRTGKDMPAAGAALGKAIMGNGRAMKELGISFKDTGDPAKNLEQIMAGLQDKVGGFAEGEAQTLDGKMVSLETKFGDVQEAVGEQLVPILLTLADVGMQVVDWISQNVSWLGPLAAGIGIAAGAMLLLNAAMAANPIGLIVIAIGALVGALIYAYQNSESFRNVVNGAFEAVGAAARWLWNNAIAPAMRAIVLGFAWVADGIAGMLEALGTIPGFEWAKEAGRNMRGLATDARAAADGIKNIPDPEVEVTFSAPGAGATEAEVKAVAATVKAIPDAASVKILAPGARPAKADVDAFMSTVKGVPKDKKTALRTIAQLGGVNAAKAALKSIKDAKPKVSVDANTKKATDAKNALDGIPKEKKPKVTINAPTKPATDAKKALDNLPKSKTIPVKIVVSKTGISSISISGTGGTVRYTIKAAARGGIFRAMASGGISGANIYSPADGVMFNEPETQGEAYIPLANDWRRPRAVSVWQETGRVLGQMAMGGITGRPTAAGGGDAITINATVARGVDPLAFAREVESALTTLRQRNGGRALAFAR